MEEHKKVVTLLTSLFEIVSFAYEDAEIAGQIQAALASAGTAIEDMDVLIAATTISANATLVTGNAKHFSRIPNVNVISV